MTTVMVAWRSPGAWPRRLAAALGRVDEPPAEARSPEEPGRPTDATARVPRPVHAAPLDLLSAEAIAIVQRPAAASRARRLVPQRVIALLAVLLLVAGALLFVLPPTRSFAYQYFEGYPHFDHLQKTTIRWWVPPPMAIDDPYYVTKIGQAAGLWSGSTTVDITHDPNGNLTPMHIAARLYWDPNDAAVGWGGPSCYNGTTHHVVCSPGGAFKLNTAHLDARRGVDDTYVTVAALHEMGHTLGLAHVWDGCGTGWHQGVMQPTMASWSVCHWATPQPDDINGIENLYSATK